MPDYKYNNQATSQAIASISAGATSVILETGKGALFPSTFPFQILIQQYNSSGVVTAQEIASCTNRVGDTLTITRANEAVPNTPSSTTQAQVARSFDVGIGIIQVTNVTTAAVFTEVVNSVKKTGAENIDGIKTFRDNIVFKGNLTCGDTTSITGLFLNFWKLNSTTNQIDSYTNGVGFRDLIINGNQLFLKGNGNVGIGTDNPTEKLQVNGNIKSSQLTIRNDSIENYSGNTDDSGINLNYIGYNGGTTRFRDVNFFNGKSQLIFRVIGNTGKISYTGDGTYGNGKVLTSDASGNATWQGTTGAKAYTSSFSSSSTLTTVPFANESFDTNNFHDNVTNNSRLTIPTGMGGVYQIIANGKVNGATVHTQTGVELWKNGALFTIGVANYNQWRAGLSFTEVDNCSVGDYFELRLQTDPNRTWDYISLTLIKQ